MRRLLLADFLHPGEHYHYARVAIQNAEPVNRHRHNFHELFWVTGGNGVHWINGSSRPLTPGTLTFIKASDEHTFSGALNIINIAFPTATWEYLSQRYNLPRYFASTPIEKREHPLSPLHLHDLDMLSENVASGERSRLKIESFLLDACQFLERLENNATPAGMPQWMREAMEKICEKQNFQHGTRYFARLAGRSPEHVSREMRRWTGKTPTDFINEARMAYASSRLIASDEPILSIALECGFESFGHFYRLFHATHRMAPNAFRRIHQSIVHG
jgi:AraC-like DNA-binding protein/mannose-6-phosphate isomerase-like protein (cupin superfamily)